MKVKSAFGNDYKIINFAILLFVDRDMRYMFSCI